MKSPKQYFSCEDKMHERLLRNIALNVELLYNDRDFDVSEYDIQMIASAFLKKNLNNTVYRAGRERYSKTDLVIEHRNNENPGKVLIELKSYVKIRNYKENKLKKKSKSGSMYRSGTYEDLKLEDIEGDFVKLCGQEPLHKNTRKVAIAVVNSANWKNSELQKDKLFKLFETTGENLKSRKPKNLVATIKDKSMNIIARSKVETENIIVYSWEIVSI